MAVRQLHPTANPNFRKQPPQSISYDLKHFVECGGLAAALTT
jgi:hypothetical protein